MTKDEYANYGWAQKIMDRMSGALTTRTIETAFTVMTKDAPHWIKPATIERLEKFKQARIEKLKATALRDMGVGP